MPDPGLPTIAAELLPDCIWELDLELRVVYASPAAAAMFGIPADALVGSPLADHLEPKDLDRLRTDLSRILAASDRTRDLLTELRIRHADGRLLPVEVHARLRLDRDGEPRALVGVARDVSERHRRRDHQRARDRERHEHQVLEALSRLAAAGADALSELLGALDATGADAGPNREAIEAARARRDQLDLLAGRRELMPQDVRVDRLVTEVLAEIQVTLPAQLALLHQPGAEQAVARLDPAATAEILRLLCAGARQAMSAGGAIRVTTGPHHGEPGPPDPATRNPALPAAAPGWVAITVTDTGEGLDPANRDRVLEPYFPIRRADASGLGLALAHQLVRQQGGRLEVESRPGRGTTIRVLLPATMATEASDGRGGRTAPRLLVVDDDPEVRRYCQRVLGADGFEVVTCEDGAEALAVMAGDEPPQAMLLDWALPGLDGRRVLEQARARKPQLPVVIISGHERRPYASLGSVDTDTPWLVKPFTPAALQEAVRRLIPRRDEARES